MAEYSKVNVKLSKVKQEQLRMNIKTTARTKNKIEKCI